MYQPKRIKIAVLQDHRPQTRNDQQLRTKSTIFAHPTHSMKKETIYILHKNGANSHYIGLKHLLEQQDIILKYREFSVLSKLFKGITKGKLGLAKKQLTNLGFFISLLFSKNKKMVLGIAPYDSKLGSLLFFLKNHHIYYHTSWSCWDKTFQPKKIKKQAVLKTWKTFLEEKIKHVFAVTHTTKQQLTEHYTIATSNISVVHHSIHPAFLKASATLKNKNSFVYYGRLVPQKGIDELLAFFKARPEATLTFIGEGKEAPKIKEAAAKCKNITILPYCTNQEELVSTIQPFQYLVVNSLKTSKWEELFGMVIIEAMSQGIIPIATAHTGPKEIITPETGYLCKEGTMTKTLEHILQTNPDTQTMASKAVLLANTYSTDMISKKWEAIL